MDGVLKVVLEVAVLVFPVSSLLAAGLAHTPQEIVGPLREKHRIVRAVVANFLLVPLLALGVSRLLGLDRPLEVGLLLLSTGAGAPFLIKLTQAAGGDVALSASLLLVLVPGTVLFMPLLVPWIEPQAKVSPAAIAVPLTLTLLVPLAAGLWIRGRRARVAAWLWPRMGKLSSVSLVVLLALTLALNVGRIAGIFGSGAILAAFLVIGGAFVIGALISSPNWTARTTLGLGTAQRNIAAAMVVASESFHNPDTLVLVVIASLVDLLVLFPIAWALRRHQGRNQPPRRAPRLVW
jgi:BASS family bile acid:Na+ symporter